MNKIQRKFLLSADILRWLEKQIFTLDKIEQFYTATDEKTAGYYLKYFPDTYTKIIIDSEGKEVVQYVKEREYVSHAKNHAGRKVLKKNYTVTVKTGEGESVFVFSEYLKGLNGLYILDASFEEAKFMRESETLETLQPFILKEIDKDQKYSDKSLALCIKPMEYNLEKEFEKIDAFEAANLFFWQVPSRIYVRDGVALLLYKNLRLLHYYKMNYQAKHFSATLHRLRVLLRRTATILETFSDFFNPKIQHFSTNLLSRYYEETKFLRYLYFLEEYSGTRENVSLSFHTTLKSLISEEEMGVTQMLLSQPFVHLIQILTRELHDKEFAQYKPLKKEVKKVVKEHLKAFEVLLAQTKEGYDDKMLEQIYSSMDTLQTLLEDFFHIIGEKETQMIVDEMNILFKPLREYRNCKEREIILNDIKKQSENKTLNIAPLLCEHEVALKERIEDALKLLRSSKFYI